MRNLPFFSDHRLTDQPGRHTEYVHRLEKDIPNPQGKQMAFLLLWSLVLGPKFSAVVTFNCLEPVSTPLPFQLSPDENQSPRTIAPSALHQPLTDATKEPKPPVHAIAAAPVDDQAQTAGGAPSPVVSACVLGELGVPDQQQSFTPPTPIRKPANAMNINLVSWLGWSAEDYAAIRVGNIYYSSLIAILIVL